MDFCKINLVFFFLYKCLNSQLCQAKFIYAECFYSFSKRVHVKQLGDENVLPHRQTLFFYFFALEVIYILSLRIHLKCSVKMK